jgi:hypothetical protein
MQNTVQEELLELIQQTIGLLKSDSRIKLPSSKEVYTYFIPPKKPVNLEQKKPQIELKKSVSVKKEKPIEEMSFPRWPSIRLKLQKIVPMMKLLDTIPDDFRAQQIANAWRKQTEIFILAGPALNEELIFLKNLARSIHDRLTTVKLISGAKLEQEKLWKSFFEKNVCKLLIIAHSAQKYTELMSYYQQGKNRLASIPIIILQPLEVYKQPDQKAALWESLCQIVTPAISPL